MSYKNNYPKLRLLLAVYFNQDWDLDYETPEDVVRAYIKDSYEIDLKKTIDQFSELLNEEHSHEEWEQILYHEFACECRFSYNDTTPRQWLEKVKKQIEDEMHLARDN